MQLHLYEVMTRVVQRDGNNFRYVAVEFCVLEMVTFLLELSSLTLPLDNLRSPNNRTNAIEFGGQKKQQKRAPTMSRNKNNPAGPDGPYDTKSQNLVERSGNHPKKFREFEKSRTAFEKI